MNHQEAIEAASKFVFVRASNKTREHRAGNVVRAYLEARAHGEACELPIVCSHMAADVLLEDSGYCAAP